MLKLQATEFVHTLADVGRLKDSIANAIVSHVTVGLSKTVDQLRTLCTQPHCRLLHLLEGARVRSMGFDISDGFHNRKKNNFLSWKPSEMSNPVDRALASSQEAKTPTVRLCAQRSELGNSLERDQQ